MITASRRAVLALPVALPVALRSARSSAQPAALRMLRIVIAAQEPLDLAPLLGEFAESNQDLLLQVTLRQEDPAWVGGAFRQEQLEGGASQVDAVITGTVGLMLGRARHLWQPLPSGLLAASDGHLNFAGRQMRPLTNETAVIIASEPGGPLLLHRPSIVRNPPRSAAALLDYARQNPDSFMYPRPVDSSLGHQFVTLVPHLLKDTDPTEPATGWVRTWPFLAELGRYIPYYAASGGAALEEFAEGGVRLLPAPLGIYLHHHMEGLLPPDTSFSLFEDAPLIAHGLFLTVPLNVPAERLPLIEALGAFLLTPDIQTRGFGRGLLRGDREFSASNFDLISTEDRDDFRRALPPSAARRLTALPVAPPLGPVQFDAMLRRWMETIGAVHRPPD